MATKLDPELLALRALGFLAETPDALAGFLNQSGATAADIRARAHDPEFLGGVLDFLLGNDEMVRHFCSAVAIDAQTVHLARHRLSLGRKD